jgi:hypothetical protein
MREILNRSVQPSAWEILAALEHKLGLKARWLASEAIRELINDQNLTNSKRDYLRGLLESEDWRNALRGVQRPAREIESTIDTLLRESTAYRNSRSFQEMVSFMANFRDYAPFNNMLVKLQNPSCSFYATQRDWNKRFSRSIKEDARPMMILAPMHPVMLVYDLDSTEGPPLPEELLNFGKFQGQWNPERLARTVTNASHRDLIRIDTRELSSTHAGFATITLNLLLGQDGVKMRIVLHLGLDGPSRYGVLLHELAHIYLGHLGGDADGWWPSRGDLTRGAMEVEAEAVAYIVSRRAGLKGASSQYVSRYLSGEEMLKAISLDQIAKVAGRVEEMGTRIMGKRRRPTTEGTRRR